ncbi:MAG: hypothetical protein AABZ16_13345 [candidate division NC10 bacterium]
MRYPTAPVGWDPVYAVVIPAPGGGPGTFEVVATPLNGDNGGDPITTKKPKGKGGKKKKGGP